MPLYGALPNNSSAAGQPATSVYPGDAVALFNAEQPAAGDASISICIPPAPGGTYRPIVFDIQFAAVPAGDIQIQGAMEDKEAAFQTLYTSTAKQQDFYNDDGGFAFYRARNSSSVGGGNLTVAVRR
jgi:hypothetical protein